MKREHLVEYFRRNYDLLLEQEKEEEEDPFATEEEPADEDEAEKPEDEEEDEGEGDEEPEEEVKVEKEDELRLQRSIDDQLQAMLIDIESDALKSAKIKIESYSLKRILLKEVNDIEIDLDKFASEVARLILNFDTFVNIKKMMIAKVRHFLTDKYGEEIASEVENILASRHDIKAPEEEGREEQEYEMQVPLAVGARSGGGA